MSKSILVVDDTRSMRAMVAAVLQGAGYEVAEAGDPGLVEEAGLQGRARPGQRGGQGAHRVPPMP